MPIAGLNFLVVEDHEFQRGLLVRMLMDLGVARVHEAADGHAALVVLQDPARPVDVVITDVRMPGMDGMEFIRRLGQTGSRLSIIIASALEHTLMASISTMTKAYGITLLGMIEKPLTPAKLLPLIGLHRPVEERAVRAAGPAFTLNEIIAGLRGDQFEPFLQPKVEIATGRIKGAEALARWRHPQKGIVAPYAFIGLLEDGGIIDELMWVMLGKSASLCGTWLRAGLDATVSVNVSVKSLADAAMADRVTQLVRSQGLDPRNMVLEVTESAVTTQVGPVLENLARLRMNGFGLSIDDYGTGYSSMQQLSRIAFTELKIDQSFVMNAKAEASARAILQSSIDLAKRLGIVSVAEGVETREDWDLLRQLGCDVAQGYLVARPLDFAAFTAWHRERERTHAAALG